VEVAKQTVNLRLWYKTNANREEASRKAAERSGNDSALAFRARGDRDVRGKAIKNTALLSGKQLNL
jgi:hypothetical protein